MENQCVGLAEAMKLSFTVKRIKTTKPWKWLPPHLWISPLSRLTKQSDTLTPPWPDIIISCGRQAIPMSRTIRKASNGNCFTIHIQTPNTSIRDFDLVIVPEHDRLRGENVLVSYGSLTRINAEKLESEKEKFSDQLAGLKSPVVTVLVGGKNRCYEMGESTMSALCTDLKSLQSNSGCFFLVTASRRTGEVNTEKLKETLQELPHIFWNGVGANPYFAFLEKADAVVVTADSVNMVSEAATAGKPVYVYPLPGGNRKFNAFHKSMQDRGYTRPFEPRLENWSAPSLNETTRMAGIAMEKFKIHSKKRDLAK
ncbi:MAG: mitochondrial fission ELM1 family protein [Sneathiellales bacterium]|nr:mitochondrial fission ELM1 family protein [Sneathiellales bacterium]